MNLEIFNLIENKLKMISVIIPVNYVKKKGNENYKCSYHLKIEYSKFSKNQ